MTKLFTTKTNCTLMAHLLALVFCIMSILVLNASMFGLVGTEYENIRSRITNGIMFVYTLYLCYESIKYIIFNKKNKAKIILIFLLPLFSIMMAIYSLLTYRFEMISNTIEMIVFMNTAYVAGVLTIEYKLLAKVFESLENWSIFYVPFSVFYLWGLIKNDGYNGAEFYGLSYLMHGMYFLIPIAVMSVSFIYNKNHKLYGFIPLKLSNPVRLVLCFFYSYTIIFSNGSRGPVLSLAFMYFMIMVFTLIRKIEVKRSILVLSFAVITLVLYVIFPLNARLMQKTDIVIENFLQGNGFVTTENVSEYIEYGNDDAAEDDAAEDDAAEDDTAKDDTAEDDTAEDDTAEGTALEDDENIATVWNLKDRGDLYTLALNEGIDNPLTGLGVFGYTNKYGLYPHNAILELIADFGIFWGVIISFIIFFLFINIFIASKQDSDFLKVIIYISPFIMLAMSSGTVYENVLLYFGVGLSLAHRVINKSREKI